VIMAPRKNKQVEVYEDHVEHLWDEALDTGMISQLEYDSHLGDDDDDDDDNE